MQLRPYVKERIDDIDRITIRTHEAAIRIIDKKGPLHNYADRDHCIQYIVAVMLVFGRLTAADYEDAVASRSAYRRAARKDDLCRRHAIHARLSRSRKAFHRQWADGGIQERREAG